MFLISGGRLRLLLFVAAEEHRRLVEGRVPGQTVAWGNSLLDAPDFLIPTLVVVLGLGEEADAALRICDGEDRSEGFWRKFDISDCLVNDEGEHLLPDAPRMHHVCPVGRIIVPPRHILLILLFVDEHLLVHAAGGDDLPEVGIGPRYPLNRPIVVLLNLVRADPLVCEHHLAHWVIVVVAVEAYLITGGVHSNIRID